MQYLIFFCFSQFNKQESESTQVISHVRRGQGRGRGVHVHQRVPVPAGRAAPAHCRAHQVGRSRVLPRTTPLPLHRRVLCRPFTLAGFIPGPSFFSSLFVLFVFSSIHRFRSSPPQVWSWPVSSSAALATTTKGDTCLDVKHDCYCLQPLRVVEAGGRCLWRTGM